MNKIILKAQAALANKSAEMYVDKVVWVLAVIVVGMALMWAVYSLMTGTIATSLESSVSKLFSTADTEIADKPTP